MGDWAALGVTLNAGQRKKCPDLNEGGEGKGMEARGDLVKSPAAALVPRLGLGGLGAEGLWSSLFMTLQWDKTPKD